MSWISYLEAKFGRFGIPGLIRAVVMFNALVFVLLKLNPDYINLIILDPALVMKGEVWRLVTYIFIPPTTSFIWILFGLMFLWTIGEGLEQALGPFKVTLFYLIGMIGTTVAAFFFGGNFSNIMLSASLLYAFATLYPNYPISFFFIVSFPIKWLAWFSFGFLLLGFAGGNAAYRIAMVASLSNYLIFFGPMIFNTIRHNKAAASRRREFQEKSVPEHEALHQCEICKRTEQSDPELEFRVSRDGHEYCLEHLPNTTATHSQPS